jgi:hypothetical protein
MILHHIPLLPQQCVWLLTVMLLLATKLLPLYPALREVMLVSHSCQHLLLPAWPPCPLYVPNTAAVELLLLHGPTCSLSLSASSVSTLCTDCSLQSNPHSSTAATSCSGLHTEPSKWTCSAAGDTATPAPVSGWTHQPQPQGCSRTNTAGWWQCGWIAHVSHSVSHLLQTAHVQLLVTAWRLAQDLYAAVQCALRTSAEWRSSATSTLVTPVTPLQWC